MVLKLFSPEEKQDLLFSILGHCYKIFHSGRYGDAAEETAPIKSDIFSYLHHLYRYMNKISQHLSSPIFLLWSLQVANFPVFLLK